MPNNFDDDALRALTIWRESLVQSTHPSVSGVLKWFAFEHLPPHLKGPSASCCGLACEIAEKGHGAEATVALRKLLEAKDAYVRSMLP